MATQIIIGPQGDDIVLNGVQNGTEVSFYADSDSAGSALDKFNKIEAYFVFGEGQTKHVPLTFTANTSQTIDIKDIAPPLFTKVGVFVSLEDDITTDGDLYEQLTTNTLVFIFDGKTLADYGIVDAFTKTEVNSLLSGKADKSEIPTKVSQLQNDSGYLTQHQDISGKADKATSLAGYGITDAYDKDTIDTMIGNVESLLSEV